MRLDRSGLQPVVLDVKAKAKDQAKSAKPEAGKSKNYRSEAAGAEEHSGPVRLKKAQVVLFTEELSELLGAGLQLEPALRVMESREELGELKNVASILRQEVRDGTSFSAALRKASSNFGDLYCSLAHAGEVSGALSTILKRQANYLSTIQDLQSRVKMALIYPSFLVASGIAVVVLFITFLIPKLTLLLKSTQGDMPPIGEFMLDMSDFLKGWGGIIILTVIIGGVVKRVSLVHNEGGFDSNY